MLARRVPASAFDRMVGGVFAERHAATLANITLESFSERVEHHRLFAPGEDFAVDLD
jgi:hypothetical protein